MELLEIPGDYSEVGEPLAPNSDACGEWSSNTVYVLNSQSLRIAAILAANRIHDLIRIAQTAPLLLLEQVSLLMAYYGTLRPVALIRQWLRSKKMETDKDNGDDSCGVKSINLGKV
jgi:hypothetical protein